MRGWFSGPGIGVLDTRYLLLDAANDPVTAGLEINAATAGEPVLILQTTDDNAANPILEIQASGGGMLSEIEKDGNLNFATATAANPGMIEVNDTRFFHTYGTNNLFIGPNAGNFTLTNISNIGIGESALSSLTTGRLNVAIGAFAGRDLTIGDFNFFLGSQSGLVATSAHDNVCIGFNAGLSMTTAFNNVCIGTSAGANITTAQNNFFMGQGAGGATTTGVANFGLGVNALANNITGAANTYIGEAAGQLLTSWWNVGAGYYTAAALTTGEKNISIGTESMRRNETGDFNVIIGHEAGRGAAGNSYDNNTAIGYRAGFALTTGSQNVLLGYQAGDVITTGASNIIIGYDIDPTGAAVNSELSIGALLYGDLANNMGGVNVTPPSLAAAWHVDQATADAAIPVLLLDQADVSEEMIEFVSTIGVGNAIEAVGAKALTTTHFIKITLPGGLTRYIPAGTIA